MSVAVQTCTKCILDTNDDPKISFDDNGVCHYCNDMIELQENHKKLKDPGVLDKLLNEIKAGKNPESKYDCIIGISGGVDSTYLAYKAKELGLNPLIVHYDNGWNSEEAVQNIEKATSSASKAKWEG